jgi:5-methylcytosine-specific restriction protein A
MPRTVPEWVGRTDDSSPPTKCKLRIVDRQQECCALTGKRFEAGDKIEFDHIVPLWLGGQNRESNLQAVLAEPHRRKTSVEATVRGKIDRNRAKRLLGKKKSSLSHPFLKKRMDGSVVDRRTGEIV